MSKGIYNTAIGRQSLRSNTTASNNTAVGYQAGYSNTTGGISAFGYKSLYSNTTGVENVGIGDYAMTTTNTGRSNVAVGVSSMYYNTTGDYNVAIGKSALAFNTTASNNTAVGYFALSANTTGQLNTAIGKSSGLSLTTGTANTFVGFGSGNEVTTGSANVILGSYDGNGGGLDIRTSSNNIVISDGDGTLRNYYRGGTGDWAWQADRIGGYGYVFDNTTSTNPYGLLIRFTNASDDDNNKYFILASDSSTTRFYVSNQGDVANHDNSYGAISDEKLKEQITDASSQWDDIKALQVRKYKMKEDVSVKGDSDEHWRLGVVAQELETAGMNGLISESIDRDSEMNDLGTTTKTVKYSILYMKAVKALQEAMERIETLEQKVATLEGA